MKVHWFDTAEVRNENNGTDRQTDSNRCTIKMCGGIYIQHHTE